MNRFSPPTQSIDLISEEALLLAKYLRDERKNWIPRTVELSEMIPLKRACEEFNLTYELKGAQRAVDLLARYYGIRRMKIVVDGRRVGNSDRACYDYDRSILAIFRDDSQTDGSISAVARPK